MDAIKVTAPDGLTLAAQTWGNPAGREILFIHGFNQAHLSWLRQVTDPALAAQYLRLSARRLPAPLPAGTRWSAATPRTAVA